MVQALRRSAISCLRKDTCKVLTRVKVANKSDTNWIQLRFMEENS